MLLADFIKDVHCINHFILSYWGCHCYHMNLVVDYIKDVTIKELICPEDPLSSRIVQDSCKLGMNTFVL
jgi:hypothetical protein